MIDKIIIDGVDVFGCCFYQEKYCTASHITCSYCCDYINCYYKQLKRKEQEYKELKEIAKEYERRWLNSYGV